MAHEVTTPPLILTIDDEEAIRVSFRDYLEDSDYRVIEAENGLKGLQLCQKENPDLILLDLSMPEMDGFELLTELNKDFPETPTIVVSGIGVISNAIKALHLGAWDYLLKPVEDLSMLEHAVEKCLERARLIRENKIYQENLEKEVAKRTYELDQTNKKLNEAIVKLTASENRFRTLSDTSPMAIMMFQNRLPIYMNQAGRDITGFTLEEISELDLLELFHTDMKAHVRQAFLQAEKEKSRYVRNEFRIVTKSKEEKWIDLSGGYIDLGGISSGIISFIDITERKTHEQALQDLNKELELRVAERTSTLETTNRELQEAKSEADQATLAKSVFLANMSHEIRTPMNGVIAAVELALQEEISPEVNRFLDIIKSSSNSLLGIINDILDFSKIEAGKLDIETKHFQLYEVLESAISPFVNHAYDKHLELLLDIKPGTPQLLIGDELRISQILSNLMSNAIKFTKENGTILIGVEEIEVDQKDNSHKLMFFVKDTGIGMTAEQQEKIFSPFTQADVSTTRKFGGTGLGLSISKRLTELMGGKIWVKSRLDKGSTFHFTVLLQAQPQESRVYPEPHAEFANKNVLIVDDNPVSVELLSRVLCGLGFNVRTAPNGTAAVEMVKQTDPHETSFDLIYIDSWMPDMNGFEALNAIKAYLKNEVPAVLMSGVGQKTKLEKKAEEIFRCLLYKPFSQSTVLETALYALGKTTTPYTKQKSLSDSLTQNYKELLGGLKILVAEDNLTNQDIAQATLEKAGIQVTIVNNGEEAVDAISKTEFDGVLMDIQMPIMDGFEATQKLRTLPAGQSIPIIAMTAHAMKGDREKCIAAGMDDYITKPINQKSLFQLLSEAIRRVPRENLPEIEPIHKEALRLPSNLPGLNIEIALQSLLISQESYLKILKKFLKYHEPFLEELRSAYKSGKTQVLLDLVHSIKGSSNNIGAFDVGEIAYELELNLKRTSQEDDNNAIEDLMIRLEQSIEILFDTIQELTAQLQMPQTTVPSTPSNVNPNELNQLIQRLYKAIKDLNPEIIRIALNNLKAITDPQSLAGISEKIESYDYEEAADALRLLAGQMGIDLT